MESIMIEDNSSDESSSTAVTSSTASSSNMTSHETQFKKSRSLQSLSSLKTAKKNQLSSSMPSEQSPLFSSHRRDSKLTRPKQLPQKQMSQCRLNSLFKLLRSIFLIAIVVLIVFQAFYNFFVFKNKITVNSIGRIGVDKLFQSSLDEDIAFFERIRPIATNQSRYIPFNETIQLTPEQIEFKRIKDENEKLYENQMFAFKNTINQVYLITEIPNQFCKRVPDTLKGYLNSTVILNNANLSNLVQFYDEKNKNKTLEQNKERIEKSKDKKAVFRDLFYLNGTEYKKNDSSMPEVNWLLWNSNNMSGLLNMSQSFFGEDGNRVELGGHWYPKDCISNFKVAIIIPYRDRLPHLKVLLYYLHLVLQRQQLDYRIFVVEPTSPPEVRFNKGRVMNAAFLEALKIDPNIDCFIFHDVDLIPEDDRTMYTCPPKPRHLSAAIDKFDYVLPYNYLVGGVFVIKTETYRKINGYSNQYWGWGAEDDDLSVRIKTNKLEIIRHPTKLARYKMIRHKQQKLNPQAHENLKKAKSRLKKDGVNTIKYEVVKKTLYTGFTHFLFDIGTLDPKP